MDMRSTAWHLAWQCRIDRRGCDVGLLQGLSPALLAQTTQLAPFMCLALCAAHKSQLLLSR